MKWATRQGMDILINFETHNVYRSVFLIFHSYNSRSCCQESVLTSASVDNQQRQHQMGIEE